MKVFFSLNLKMDYRNPKRIWESIQFNLANKITVVAYRNGIVANIATFHFFMTKSRIKRASEANPEIMTKNGALSFPEK